MAAYKDGDQWRYRGSVIADGKRIRYSGAPVTNTKRMAQAAERAAVKRLLASGPTIGRPPEDGVTRSIIVQTRVTEDERARWQATADHAEMSLGEWIRNVCNIGAE